MSNITNRTNTNDPIDAATFTERLTFSASESLALSPEKLHSLSKCRKKNGY